MKQKVVIGLSLSGCDQKFRIKVFKKVVCQPGVESAAMTGSENNQLVVVGEHIDAVKLMDALRHSEIVNGCVSHSPKIGWCLRILNGCFIIFAVDSEQHSSQPGVEPLASLPRKSLRQAEVVSIGPAGGGDKKKDDTKP